jgi:GTP-binding protein
LIDIAGLDPVEAMRVVEGELEAYGAGLTDKARIVALNKTDLADDELVEAFTEELLAAGVDKVFPISGAAGHGIEPLLDAVLGYLPQRTATENPSEIPSEDDEENEGPRDWSPLD